MATRSAISQSAETRSNKNRTGIKRSNPERISCVPNDVRLRAALVFLHDVGGMKAARKSWLSSANFDVLSWDVRLERSGTSQLHRQAVETGSEHIAGTKRCRCAESSSATGHAGLD